jgi:nitrate reductase cytochrome c-type subunit
MPVSHYVPAVTTLKLNCHVSVSMKTCNYMTIFSLHLRSKYRVDGDTRILRSSSKYQSTQCYVPQDLSVFEHLDFPIR